MALKFFIAQVESVTFPGNDYNNKTSPIVFVPELFACYLTANLLLGGHLGSYFRNTQYILFSVCRDYERFVKKLSLLNHCYGKYSRESNRRSVTVPI